jgi:predicted nucleotidyltransferase
MRDLTREQLLLELRALKPQFERKGVAHLAIFGSRARGDNRPDSDVDLLLEAEPNRKFSLLDAISAGHIVQDNLGLETSVVVLDKYAPAEFVHSVQRDRVAVF